MNYNFQFNKKTLLVLVAVFLIANNTSVFAVERYNKIDSLCRKNEVTILSCSAMPLKSHRKISLCSSQILTPNSGNIYIRAGLKKNSKINLSIDLTNQKNKVHYYYDEFPKGFISALSFQTENSSIISISQTKSVYGNNSLGIFERRDNKTTKIESCDIKSIKTNKDMSAITSYFDLRRLEFQFNEDMVDFESYYFNSYK